MRSSSCTQQQSDGTTDLLKVWCVCPFLMMCWILFTVHHAQSPKALYRSLFRKLSHARHFSLFISETYLMVSFSRTSKCVLLEKGTGWHKSYSQTSKKQKLKKERTRQKLAAYKPNVEQKTKKTVQLPYSAQDCIAGGKGGDIVGQIQLYSYPTYVHPLFFDKYNC